MWVCGTLIFVPPACMEQPLFTCRFLFARRSQGSLVSAAQHPTVTHLAVHTRVAGLRVLRCSLTPVRPSSAAVTLEHATQVTAVHSIRPSAQQVGTCVHAQRHSLGLGPCSRHVCLLVSTSPRCLCLPHMICHATHPTRSSTCTHADCLCFREPLRARMLSTCVEAACSAACKLTLILASYEAARCSSQ